MKTTFKTFVFSFALCAAVGATAQTWSASSAQKADTMMLSETTDGDYIVRKFIVKSQGASDYTVRYTINQAALNTRLDDNSQELADLDRFVETMTKDTLMKVKTIFITGYASPDGSLSLNEALARKRALDFKSYVDKKYNLSNKFDVKINSLVDNWSAASAAVSQSSTPDKAKVLEIIDGKQWTPEQKEAALKKMPAAVWEYLAREILPPLRRVELAIDYGKGNLVEQRTMIPKPKPQPAPAPAPKKPCCEVVDESITGIIVEMPESDGAYDRQERKEVRGMNEMTRIEQKAARKEARQAEKLAKKEACKAKKIARKADKMAKKAEKTAAKIAKEQVEADRKAAKAMEKM